MTDAQLTEMREASLRQMRAFADKIGLKIEKPTREAILLIAIIEALALLDYEVATARRVLEKALEDTKL